MELKTSHELARELQADLQLMMDSAMPDAELRGAFILARAQATRWGIAHETLPKPLYLTDGKTWTDETRS